MRVRVVFFRVDIYFINYAIHHVADDSYVITSLSASRFEARPASGRSDRRLLSHYRALDRRAGSFAVSVREAGFEGVKGVEGVRAGTAVQNVEHIREAAAENETTKA